jgi:hypothetical protein
VTPLIPKESGFYSVEIAVPGDVEWCEETRDSFVSWMSGMPGDEYSDALLAMPSLQIDAHEDQGELILQWVARPADNAWDAVEKIVDKVAKIAFPDLLRKSLAVRVVATCERAVGRDVVVPDEPDNG